MKKMLFLEKRYLGCSAQEMGISLRRKPLDWQNQSSDHLGGKQQTYFSK